MQKEVRPILRDLLLSAQPTPAILQSGIELEAWRLAEISRRKEEKTTLTLRRRIQYV